MTSALPRPCLGCGDLSPDSYCQPCHRERVRVRQQQRGSTKSRGYGSRWQALSRKARRLQPFCIDCGTSEDLTGDHIVPLARSDRSAVVKIEQVAVRCRSCNGRKGAR